MKIIKELTIKELFAVFLETKEKIHNRPDAMFVLQGSLKGRSHYQTKMLKIKEIAVRMKPATQNEQYMLKVILGKETEKQIIIL